MTDVPPTSDMPLRLRQVVFNGGQALDLGDIDVVVLVGPNNAGKSRSLRELFDWLSIDKARPVPPEARVTLSSADFDFRTDAEGLVRWLEDHRSVWTDPSSRAPHVRTVGVGDFALDHLLRSWNRQHLQFASGHLIRGLWCEERLSYMGSPGRPDVGSRLDHPIQRLVTDSVLLARFRAAFKAAFGLNVIVDAWGNAIRLRLSAHMRQEDFVSSTDSGLPDASMVERLAALSTIETQSDGVRSFAGMLLTVLTGEYPLVLLDEPETFLHPPQARLLGRFLNEFRGSGQLVIATHSIDVLLGLVEATSSRLLIARLTRESDQTSASVLSPEELGQIWDDPMLRFSRALDGLFHEKVVVCEGDTDALFYQATAAHLAEQTDEGADVMFTFAGGKQRMPLVAGALRAVSVPVRAVCDFDVLRDPALLRKIVESVGGSWSDIFTTDLRLLDAHIRRSESPLTVRSVREAVTSILAERADDEQVSSSLKRAVSSAMAPASGWRAAKEHGTGAVPHGDAQGALERLLQGLRAQGVFVVPGGAVESFVPVVGSTGPKWVLDVLERGLIADAQSALEFVAALRRP